MPPENPGWVCPEWGCSRPLPPSHPRRSFATCPHCHGVYALESSPMGIHHLPVSLVSAHHPWTGEPWGDLPALGAKENPCPELGLSSVFSGWEWVAPAKVGDSHLCFFRGRLWSLGTQGLVAHEAHGAAGAQFVPAPPSAAEGPLTGAFPLVFLPQGRMGLLHLGRLYVREGVAPKFPWVCCGEGLGGAGGWGMTGCGATWFLPDFGAGEDRAPGDAPHMEWDEGGVRSGPWPLVWSLAGGGRLTLSWQNDSTTFHFEHPQGGLAQSGVFPPWFLPLRFLFWPTPFGPLPALEACAPGHGRSLWVFGEPRGLCLLCRLGIPHGPDQRWALTPQGLVTMPEGLIHSPWGETFPFPLPGSGSHPPVAVLSLGNRLWALNAEGIWKGRFQA